jgi:hypothetical protein
MYGAHDSQLMRSLSSSRSLFEKLKHDHTLAHGDSPICRPSSVASFQ